MSDSGGRGVDPLLTNHSMLVRMRLGEDGAWLWFVDRYDAFVREVLRRSIWPEAKLVAATTEFWSFAFEKRLVHKHDPSRRFRAFLSGCLVNFSRKWNRAGRIRHVQSCGEAPPDLPDPQDTSEGFERQELATWADHVLHIALCALADEARHRDHAEVLCMFYGLTPRGPASEPLSGAAIATRLGIQANAVHARLHRARAALRRVLESEILQTVGEPGALAAELDSVLGAIAAKHPGVCDRR